MTVGKRHEQLQITFDGEELEQVNEFVYLGGLVTEDGQAAKNIKRRIGLASAAFGKLDKMWRTSNISSKTKIKLYETLIILVLLYGPECWCLRKTDEKKILVAEIAWLRRILRMKMEHIRNEVIRQRLGQTESLTDRIRQTRLKWFGHVTRMNETHLPARAMYSYVEGTRSRGRQRKKWINNVKEDLDFHRMDLQAAINMIRNQEQWRRLAKSSSSATTDG